ncbi:DUF4350 domain-containing protein, partial [Demequina sp.]|uniref:DUF4350 domain-containing protein n=1 Tax=Demequina sp. TaxID=2050685 RepID=UPI0025D42958
MTTATDFRTAPAGPGLKARARSGRWGIVAVLLFVLLVASLALGARPGDYTALSTENSTPTGTRALAQILRDHGVEVRQVDRLAQARVTDPENTTVVIAEPALLTDGQAGSLAEYPGDLVLVGSGDTAFDALGIPIREAPVPLPEAASAQCADPDAAAAQEVRVEDWGVVGTGSVVGAGVDLCFAQRGGVSAYAAARDGGRSVAVIASTGIVTNGALDQLGHAALAIRATGRHPQVVWYVADGLDPSLLTWSGSGAGAEPPSEIDATPDFLPPGTGSALYALALAALVGAFWRARRFGALVPEPLPVVVRASEATRGR